MTRYMVIARIEIESKKNPQQVIEDLKEGLRFLMCGEPAVCRIQGYSIYDIFVSAWERFK